MTFTIPEWALWMLTGYVAGRGLELLVKFQMYLDNQVSEPRGTHREGRRRAMVKGGLRSATHRPPPPPPMSP